MTVAADLAILRAILADYQDVISGPDVRLGMDAAGRVEAEIARAEAKDAADYLASLKAAEAEVARLRDGLRRITREPWCGCQSCACRRRSRALLAEDGAA